MSKQCIPPTPSRVTERIATTGHEWLRLSPLGATFARYRCAQCRALKQAWPEDGSGAVTRYYTPRGTDAEEPECIGVQPYACRTPSLICCHGRPDDD